MNIIKLTAVASLVLSVALSGCTTVNPKVANFKPQYYPQCYSRIQDLCKDQDTTGRTVAATTGVVVGALVGALIGASTGDRNHVLAGAAIGATAGGALGYGLNRIQAIHDEHERLEALQKELGSDADQLNLTQASVTSAFKCYSEAIDEIKADVKAKRMNRAEAAQRMAEIKEGIENLKIFWDERASEMDKKADEYDKFIISENQRIKNEQHRAQMKRALAKRNSYRAELVNSNQEVNLSYEDVLRKFRVAENA